MLGALAAGGDVTVIAFPMIEGEKDGPIRQVAITDVDGAVLVSDEQLTRPAADFVEGLRGEFRPEDASARDSALVLTYGLWVDEFID